MRKLFISIGFIAGLSIMAFGQSGKIMGKLIYPGEFIPADLVLCIKITSVYAQPTFCSNGQASRLRAAGISFRINCRRASYRISLPAGTVYLYASTSEMPGVKAYHDELIKCGVDIKCQSKRPVAITVKAGEVVSGITVGDFWE